MSAKGGDGLPVTWWDVTASWLETPLALHGSTSITQGVAVLIGTALLLYLVAILSWRPNKHPLRRNGTAPKPERYTELERDSMKMGGWR